MRSRWRPTLAVAFALLAAGLLMTMATDERDLAFTLGVRPTQVATVIGEGERACQRPIDVPADAASLELQIGTFGRPGPPLDVSVVSPDGSPGGGRLPGGYPDNARPRVRVDGVREGDRIAVCITNRGRDRVALYGGPPLATRTSALFAEGNEEKADMTLLFGRDPARSTLSLLPSVFDRAALFHPSWAGSWLFWLLGALLATAVPALLLLALSGAASACEAEPDAGDRKPHPSTAR